MSKKIIIVSAYFYPDITPRSFRTTELVKQLVSLGHDVTLYIPYRDFDYTLFLKEWNFNLRFINTGQLNISLPLGKESYKRIIRFFYYKLMKYTEYPTIKLYFKIPKSLIIENNTNLLISIAAPHSVHWGIEKALKKMDNSKLKWIADCGDPYMGDKTSSKPFYFRRFEKKFCKRADFITVPLEDAIKLYYPQFRNKIRIIPQGFDLSDKNRYTKSRKNSIPTFAYAGVFYPGYRDPQMFFNFLTTIDVNYKMILYTKENTITRKYKTILGDKIELRDFIQREELLQELSQMDFLINFENKEKGQLPSKLIDYYIANRPVLSIPFDNINQTKILSFLKRDYRLQLQFNDIEEYDIKNVTQKFLSL